MRLFIRRLSNKALAVLVVLLGMALASFAVFNVSGYGNREWDGHSTE